MVLKVYHVSDQWISLVHYGGSIRFPLRIRVYKPKGEVFLIYLFLNEICSNFMQGPFPIVVFFHGGGWVICDLDTHDEICRHISIKVYPFLQLQNFLPSPLSLNLSLLYVQTNCVVVSVDYRLAPEFKFPIPVEDAYAAAVYICEHAASFYGNLLGGRREIASIKNENRRSVESMPIGR
jgi:acetyl esterase/lipase